MLGYLVLENDLGAAFEGPGSTGSRSRPDAQTVPSPAGGLSPTAGCLAETPVAGVGCFFLESRISILPQTSVFCLGPPTACLFLRDSRTGFCGHQPLKIRGVLTPWVPSEPHCSADASLSPGGLGIDTKGSLGETLETLPAPSACASRVLKHFT